MRTVFETRTGAPACEEWRNRFSAIAEKFNMKWELQDTSRKPKVVIMVSKQRHCLNDLLHRYDTGWLNMDIAAVISNHPDLAEMAQWYKIPFHHLPVAPETKMEQEAEVYKLIKESNADLVILARYMQVLSSGLSAKLKGRAINIHHSFLPSFKGAKPYHQAYERGVKRIGATAHYVTDDLDEGPIIEQEVIAVDHTHSPNDLVALGCDIENQVLARAVKYHLECRVLLNGNKTVVFK
jgi:formyltetrahydrofolate deformylase